jgi:energy-converting hydrogenase Eha subunit F
VNVLLKDNLNRDGQQCHQYQQYKPTVGWVNVLLKDSLNRDGQQCHQYQQYKPTVGWVNVLFLCLNCLLITHSLTLLLVCIVDIGGIVDHLCLNCLLITHSLTQQCQKYQQYKPTVGWVNVLLNDSLNRDGQQCHQYQQYKSTVGWVNVLLKDSLYNTRTH